MSQIIKSLMSGPVPPQIPTSFETQNGTAVPAANILIVNGFDSNENNDNGIITKGGVVGTGTSNEVDIVLTNRQTATVTTIDATPTTILTFPLGATPGTYAFEGSLLAYDLTDVASGAYTFSFGVRTTGAAGVDLGVEFKDQFEEAATAALDFNVTSSGNNFIVEVIGIAAKTINWNCQITYRFVS